ncbi:TonB-dependent receptor domain-containing protein [Rubrolithibacter danxiaensis]|uniref:TonB-dependent receptor domain-containing protein n=1 Tax=Rubrolithibacter danxiaensis TaxID=3390805 RepID=UPI003BF78681
MRSKILLLVPVLFFIASPLLCAQSAGKISGSIDDNTNQPLESATILLLKLPDSSLVKTSLSGTDGKFVFENLKEGSYSLKVSMMGYTSFRSKNIVIDAANPHIELPVITLQTNPNMLKEVAVLGQKSLIEQKTDRTVVNVDALISNTGTNALELLEKTPGVTVDQNGSISLKGKSGVLVLIDDRPTYLSAADLAAYLKSLPSGTINQIELITNPPAKYDAAGNAGVINIKTKKSKINGINGSFSASIGKGVYWRNNESINLNYRINKFNFFTNASFNMQDSWRQLDLERRYFQPDGTLNSVFASTSFFYPEERTPTLKAGIDYYLSDKTTIGIVLNGSYNTNDESRPVNSELFNGTGSIDSLIYATNGEDNVFKNGSINLNFNHQYDSTGKSLSFDLDYVKYNSGTDQSFRNNIFFPDNTLKSSEILKADLPSVINIYSAKADYTLPIKGKAKIAAGVKTSYVSTDNAANYFNYINNVPSVDYNKTNRFRYKENINAAYLNFNKDFRRLSLQTGLRLENTIGDGHQLGNAAKPDSSFRNNYTSLFPTAYLSYKLDTGGKKLLNFSYGRRIGRPYYQDLNPFVFLLDKFSYFSGNPFLKPEFSNNFELSFNQNNRFTLSLLYNYATDVFTESIEQKGNVFVSSTGNIGKRINAGVSVNTTLKKGSWWMCNIYAELMNNKFRGDLPSSTLNSGSTYFSIRPNNQFTFKHGWSAELTGFYNSKSTYGQFEIGSRWAVDAGIQKKILSNKGTLKLSARDIFHTIEPSGKITNIPNAEATFHNYLDTRVVIASFTYSFSKGTAAKSKQNTGGADEEQQRVKN